MTRVISRISSGLNFGWVVTFALLVGTSHYLGTSYFAKDIPFEIVAGVYLLPNPTYLYVFAWVPLAVYPLWHFFGQGWSGAKARFVAGIFGFSFLTFLLAATAQLYLFWILPFGLLTLVTSLIFFWKAMLLLRSSGGAFQGRKQILEILLGPALILLASTIYLQPWSLVFKLPHVTEASLQGLDLRGMHFLRVSFTDSDLSGINFSGATLSGVKFINVKMDGATFDGARLGGVTFENVVMDGASFQQAKIENTDMERASLKNADFREAWLYQSNITESDLTAANFNESSIGRTFIEQSKLCAASFEGEWVNVYGWDGSIRDAETTLPSNNDAIGKLPELVEQC